MLFNFKIFNLLIKIQDEFQYEFQNEKLLIILMIDIFHLLFYLKY
jgi:hypothetical protein